MQGIEAEPVYVDIEFKRRRARDPEPAGTHNAFVYCYQGAVTVGDADPTLIGHRRLAVLSGGPEVSLSAGNDGAKVIVVAGKPFNEPVARYGPFVMNTREELMQAVEDLRNGRF